MYQTGVLSAPTSDFSDAIRTILIVEDDLVTRHYLARTLQDHQFRVVETATGEDGLTQACVRQPHAVLLDMGLPDISGLEVVRRLREWTATPIIILSLRNQEQDKVAALDAGADDYLTKPCGTPELLARLRANMRRAMKDHETKSPYFSLGEMCINFPRRQVTVRGKEVRLTRLEYNLLALLARHAGEVVPHRQLLQEVWGPQYSTETNYLRLYVKQLRDKIEPEPAQPSYLLTEAGVGYRLSDR